MADRNEPLAAIKSRRDKTLTALVAGVPYIRWLGIQFDRRGGILRRSAVVCAADGCTFAQRAGACRDRPADRECAHLVQCGVHAGVAAADPADGAVCVPPCAGPGSAVSFYWTNIPIAHILKGMKPTAEQKGNIAMRQKIGRVCMVLGALLILAAAALLAYNKWDASRADKASQEVLGELEQTLNAAIEEKAKSDTVALQPELDPTQEMTVTELNGWDYIGYLSIPSIGLELPVMSQWSYAGLKIAPGRYSGSTYADNMVVCAHNYAKHFSPIKWLTEGAQVYFTDMDGMRWTYEVSYVENLQPTQIEEMTEKTEESDEWDLTLFTCTTGGSARCAVRCVRTGYPALTTETAE